jgi:hypothetical protein
MLTAQERAIIRSADQIKRARRKMAKADRPRVEPVKKNRGRVRDNGHLAFIRRLPCVATYVSTGRLEYGCEAAHLRMPSALHGKPLTGKSVKPDDKWTTPLSPNQHFMQGNVFGEAKFWSFLGVDPFDLCERLYAVSGDDDAALKIITAIPRKS